MIHRGEIYLVDLSQTIGSEQGGIRPAIIVQNEAGNMYSPTTIVCPLTSKSKTNIPTHVSLTPEDCGIIKNSTVLCEQVRAISKERLKKKLGEIKNVEKINDINKKIIVSLGLTISEAVTR